jgi:hypothetical protein
VATVNTAAPVATVATTMTMTRMRRKNEAFGRLV